MDLGFYYMANAMGRLVGTLLGGFLYFYTVSVTQVIFNISHSRCTTAPTHAWR